jgi:hypothetical protein
MPLEKISLKPGVNRENTRYTNEGGYYESEKVRFRQGTPEKIGGWTRLSSNTFLGVCRSLWNWVTLASQNLLGVGTNLKFYIENGGYYYDVTPIRAEHTLTNPFTPNGTTTILVTDATGGFINNDFVTFYGGTAVGGQTITGEYQITYLTDTTYNITISAAATAGAAAGGTVYAVYQINTGPYDSLPVTGWGAGAWSAGSWGVGGATKESIRIWNQNNFGQDLIYGPQGGPMYYWNASIGTAPSDVTMTLANPCVVTTTLTLLEATPIQFETTGALPTALTVGTTYYTKNVSGNTFNLAATAGGTAINTAASTQSGTQSISARGVLVSSLNGADSVPLYQNYLLVSDASRFVLVFGTNEIGTTTLDPMLIRWSDQESVTQWYPAITNQAGFVRLSHGSKIITALQSRQEIVVWTDSSLYSLQYLGPPYVWGNQLLGDNISIAGTNAAALASGIVYWMGVDKFYKYDGRVQTLRCDLRQFIYDDINTLQFNQVYASTNEGFNEVWWFYCTQNSAVIDRYVVYNYLEDVWYYGSMGRTAWLDTGLRQYPLAATYSNNIVNHEDGVDDGTLETALPIEASITSSQFDIGDGHNFAFVWRMLPDLTFRGSTDGTTPALTIQLLPLQNSGSGYNDPKSIGGTSADASQAVTATQTYPIDLDTFTGQLNIRVRGRQMSMKVISNKLGTQWQLGSPRIDIRPDGRRGG